MLYLEINIPDGVEAIEFTWKQLISALKDWQNSWFDAELPGPRRPKTCATSADVYAERHQRLGGKDDSVSGARRNFDAGSDADFFQVQAGT